MSNNPLRLVSVVGVLTCLALAALACNYRPPQRAQATPAATEVAVAPGDAPAPATPEAGAPGTGLLTVCMGQEPASLFIYGDQSASARSVRQAIYDGPFDWSGAAPTPVMLEALPTLANGALSLEAVDVQPGQPVVDVAGKVVQLAEGVSYFPSGCTEIACAVSYTSGAPARLDVLSARFTLKSGLKWSDGQPLTAADSIFSYNVARGLYPMVAADLLDRTAAYAAKDERTVEWRGLPGYRFPTYAAVFFTPLPQHTLGTFSPKDLLAQDAAARQPLGWGPYTLTEWTQGDHITLARNPNYFRAAEGLPHFEKLVFRFMGDARQALDALRAGECDVLDESLHLEALGDDLKSILDDKALKVLARPGAGVELLDFGLLPAQTPESGGPLPLFNSKETRQAIAQCIDRQKLADTITAIAGEVPLSYVAPQHPLASKDAKAWAYDPQAANQALEAAGWKDADGSSASPRTAQGVNGIPDGTPLKIGLMIGDAPEKQRLASALQEMLAGCGVQIDLDVRPADVIYAAGPSGPIFGRQFSLAQFGWASGIEPGCALFTTSEIPGPYPEFPRGWGGANAGGYSNPDFDRWCKQATASLPEWGGYAQAHQQAQIIFADDVPALPLYTSARVVIARSDLCWAAMGFASESFLYDVENFQNGTVCP